MKRRSEQKMAIRKQFKLHNASIFHKDKMQKVSVDSVESESKKEITLTDLIGSPFLRFSPLNSKNSRESKREKKSLTWKRNAGKDYKTFFSRPRIPLEVPISPTTSFYSWKKENCYSSLESRQMGHLAQKGEEWLKRRKKVITGSRLANILGFWGWMD